MTEEAAPKRKMNRFEVAEMLKNRTPEEWVIANTAASKRSAEVRGAAKRKRQDGLLTEIRNGLSVKDACVRCGLSYQTYRHWMRTDPSFNEAAFAARDERLKPVVRINHKPFVEQFAQFRERFLKRQSPAFHLEAVKAFASAEPGSVTLLLWPPEHGKTSLLEDFATFMVATKPDTRIVVASENQSHSRKVLSLVRSRLEPGGAFPDLVKTYGPFAPQTKESEHHDEMSYGAWGRDAWTVHKKRQSDERDYSMVALGLRSGIVGTRADYLFVDDAQSRKTLNQTEVLVDTFRQDWLTRPGPLGRTFIVGTRVGEHDFYQKLLEAGIIDRVIVFQAHDTKGNWLWPERYTAAMYERMRRNVGESAWARNYMQEPEPAGSTHFPPELLAEATDPLLRVWADPPADAVRTAIAIDPGFGVNATMCAAFCPNRMVILDGREDKELKSNQDIINVAEEMMLAHSTRDVPCTDWIIEDKAFQRGLFHDEALKSVKKRHGVVVSGHQTGANKHDPNIGVAAMQRAFARGEIILPGAPDPATQAFRDTLDGELRAWRPDRRGNKLKQDMVMTLWFLWLLWRRHRHNVTVGPSHWNSTGVAWSPTTPKLIIPVGAFK